MFRLLRIFAESTIVTINNTERLSVINQYGRKRVLEFVFLGSFSLVPIKLSDFCHRQENI